MTTTFACSLHVSFLVFSFFFASDVGISCFVSLNPVAINNRIRELCFGIFGTSRLVRAWYENLRPCHRSDNIQL
jgi:hypothetical protein